MADTYELDPELADEMARHRRSRPVGGVQLAADILRGISYGYQGKQLPKRGLTDQEREIMIQRYYGLLRQMNQAEMQYKSRESATKLAKSQNMVDLLKVVTRYKADMTESQNPTKTAQMRTNQIIIESGLDAIAENERATSIEEVTSDVGKQILKESLEKPNSYGTLESWKSPLNTIPPGELPVILQQASEHTGLDLVALYNIYDAAKKEGENDPASVAQATIPPGEGVVEVSVLEDVFGTLERQFGALGEKERRAETAEDDIRKALTDNEDLVGAGYTDNITGIIDALVNGTADEGTRTALKGLGYEMAGEQLGISPDQVQRDAEDGKVGDPTTQDNIRTDRDNIYKRIDALMQPDPGYENLRIRQEIMNGEKFKEFQKGVGVTDDFEAFKLLMQSTKRKLEESPQEDSIALRSDASSRAPVDQSLTLDEGGSITPGAAAVGGSNAAETDPNTQAAEAEAVASEIPAGGADGAEEALVTLPDEDGSLESLDFNELYQESRDAVSPEHEQKVKSRRDIRKDRRAKKADDDQFDQDYPPEEDTLQGDGMGSLIPDDQPIDPSVDPTRREWTRRMAAKKYAMRPDDFLETV